MRGLRFASALFDSSDDLQQQAFPHYGFERNTVNEPFPAGCDPNGYHLK
jgi:hypothetical protein